MGTNNNGVKTWGGRGVTFSLLIKPLGPTGDPTIMTSFNFKYLLKILSPNAVTLEVRAPIYVFWKDTNHVIKLVSIGKMVLTTGVSKL